MSNYESFRQTLNAEQLELFEAKIASDREQYSKIQGLVQEVHGDENSRLPYIPAFYRTRSIEDEQRFLDTVIPRVEAARGEEFCLSACQKEGPSCLQSCKQFTLKAFSIGGNLIASLHKPYRFTSFEGEAEE